jgi:hypothetical protein
MGLPGAGGRGSPTRGAPGTGGNRSGGATGIGGAAGLTAGAAGLPADNATGGALASGGGKSTGGSATAGQNAGGNELGGSAGSKATGGAAGANSTGGTKTGDGGTSAAKGGTSGGGATATKGGASSAGGARSGGTTATSGGVATSGGASGSGALWPNIRVVGNQMRDRRGNAFAIRGIESMFGNGSSDAVPFVAGHKALGANTVSPLPNSSVATADAVQSLVDAAYQAGLVLGLNADHANQGERFFQNKDIQAIVNHYPNVFLQEAVELGSNMTESEWVDAAKHKVDAYVSLYPDKPLKIGSPDGGRSPRYALDRCQDVVDYYKSKGGRGGLIFTCQLYWKASTASWSYQNQNGFKDGLPGILEAIDAMAASPCYFLPGLDNQDDVGYTGWRVVTDHIRTAQSDPTLRTSFQWWVYFNSGDSYANDLTTKANDALSGITATGRDVKAKLEMDRTLIDLGPLNP